MLVRLSLWNLMIHTLLLALLEFNLSIIFYPPLFDDSERKLTAKNFLAWLPKNAWKKNPNKRKKIVLNTNETYYLPRKLFFFHAMLYKIYFLCAFSYKPTLLSWTNFISFICVCTVGGKENFQTFPHKNFFLSDIKNHFSIWINWYPARRIFIYIISFEQSFS